MVVWFNNPLLNKHNSPKLPQNPLRDLYITTNTEIGLDLVGTMEFTSEAKIDITTGTNRENPVATTIAIDEPIQPLQELTGKAGTGTTMGDIN